MKTTMRLVLSFLANGLAAKTPRRQVSQRISSEATNDYGPALRTSIPICPASFPLASWRLGGQSLSPFRLIALLSALVCATALTAADKDSPPFTPGQVFQFSPTTPKYVTSTCEFRDPADVRWPTIFSGRASEGSFTADAQAPKAAFTLVCGTLAQAGGDRSRRVLGELPDGQLTVTLRLLSLGEPVASADKKKGQVHAAKAELTANGKTVPLSGTAELRYDGKPANLVQLTMRFSLSGKDLGLATMPGPIALEVRAAGVDPGQGGKKK